MLPDVAKECPGFQEGSRVLMSISSITQSIAVTWSCPCARVSLCWEIPGRLRNVSCQSKFGDRGLYASIKKPILQLWKGFLVVFKIYASKKITCCRNTTQGRNCCREGGVGIEQAGGQSSGSVYTGKCCSQHTAPLFLLSAIGKGSHPLLGCHRAGRKEKHP